MIPLIALFGVFALVLLIQRAVRGEMNIRSAGRIAMAAMLVFTAIGHFVFTEGMAAMMPEFIPWKKEFVIATGVLEIVLAISLLIPKYQSLTGWLLIAFFVAILPANIKAAMEGLDYQTGQLDGPGPEYLWFRIPLQVMFICWVFFSAVREKG